MDIKILRIIGEALLSISELLDSPSETPVTSRVKEAISRSLIVNDPPVIVAPAPIVAQAPIVAPAPVVAPAPALAPVEQPVVPSSPDAAPTPPITQTPAVGTAPPPPVSPTVAPAPTPTIQPASDVELDVKGFPWDERIHASTKSKVISGEWKKKRGVDAALVAEVEASLGQSPEYAENPGLTKAPTIAPTPTAPTGKTLPELMDLIIKRGGLPEATIAEICTRHGITPANLTGVAKNPAVIPAIYAEIEALA